MKTVQHIRTHHQTALQEKSTDKYFSNYSVQKMAGKKGNETELHYAEMKMMTRICCVKLKDTLLLRGTDTKVENSLCCALV